MNWFRRLLEAFWPPARRRARQQVLDLLLGENFILAGDILGTLGWVPWETTIRAFQNEKGEYELSFQAEEKVTVWKVSCPWGGGESFNSITLSPKDTIKVTITKGGRIK